ncbi:MAG: hypothetical protein GY818_18705 [Planctomycetaceae bacterium]|nr:hypothetical protein [Planctomycetaceae bacterium]
MNRNHGHKYRPHCPRKRHPMELKADATHRIITDIVMPIDSQPELIG